MLIPFNELFRRHNVRPDGVLHLGANDGQEAEAYYRAGIRNVIWVEALPVVFRKLIGHIRTFPGQRAHIACVSDVDGQKVKFNEASNGGQSSSLLPFGTHSKEHPTVRFTNQIDMITTRVDTLLRFHKEGLDGRWFLNADLQGAELMALRGMGDLLKKFWWAYLEVNERELYKGCPLVPEIDGFMAAAGFKGTEEKMTNFGWGDKFYVRCSRP